MTLSRRTAIAAGTASLLLPSRPAQASLRGTRSFRVLRDGSDIGSHTVKVTRSGETLQAQTEIRIAVKFLGVTAYRYELTYEEVYRNGQFESLRGTSNDDGEAGYVNATRANGQIQIDGSGYSGPVTGGATPTSYWRKSGLSATPWISTQSGKVLPVTTTEVAPTAQTPSGSRAWRASDADEINIDLWYDDTGEWMGCAFPARGEVGFYQLVPGSDSLAGFTA